jgi:hypothetical protein
MREAQASGRASFITGTGDMSKAADMQKLALSAFLKSPEGSKYASMFDEEKKNSFKPPEGFSNVVGVGANPVMEAMAEQLDIQKQQLAALQEIANKGTSPTDFTKESK